MWKKLTLSIGASLLWACSGGDISAPAPEAFELTFPENNSLCLEGQVQNALQSQVRFRWTYSSNATGYELTVINLMTNERNTYNTTETRQNVVLNHDEPYIWKVTAQGEDANVTLESETWKFYLAGEAETTYAPFPAELISPRSGSTVTLVDGAAVLNWSVNDVDNDLRTIKIYLDTDSTADTLLQTVDYAQADQQISTELEDGTLYYWRVEAIDAEGNVSDSGTYTFRTQ